MRYLAAGVVLKDRYEILEEIGRGGYSVVYRANDRAVTAVVAIKLLVPPPLMAEVARERMRREVQAVRGLAHPNIVAVHDFLQDGESDFIVMEYVAGPDLSIRLRDHGTLPAAEVTRIGSDIGSALGEAHRRGILHRDVKPQNILLDPSGRARLTDFGSARLDGQSTVTHTGGLVGTLSYTPPEVLAGRRGDARSDLYSLGMTLYLALTGELPHRPSPHLPPPPQAKGFHPAAVRPEIPEWLDATIARATAADARDRFPSAASLVEALSEQHEGRSPQPQRPAPLDFCLLCGVDEPLGLGVCSGCSNGLPRGESTALLIHSPARASERAILGASLSELAGPAVDPAAVTATVAGERVLAVVPLGGAERVIDQLSRRGIPTRAVRGQWTPLPRPLYLVASSMAVAGIAAGLAVVPHLLWASPLLASLVVLEAQRRVQRPLLNRPRHGGTLPAATRALVAETAAGLSAGTALGLFGELVRMGQALDQRLVEGLADPEARKQLNQLLILAASAAKDLAEVEDTLDGLERQRERFAGDPAEWSAAVTQAERLRDSLVQRMLEVITRLGQMRTTQVAAGGASGEEMEELSRELAREVSAYAEAVKEVAQLTR